MWLVCNDFLHFPWCLVRPPAATEGLMQCLFLFLSALFVQLWSAPISCEKGVLLQQFDNSFKACLGNGCCTWCISTLISWNRNTCITMPHLNRTKTSATPVFFGLCAFFTRVSAFSRTCQGRSERSGRSWICRTCNFQSASFMPFMQVAHLPCGCRISGPWKLYNARPGLFHRRWEENLLVASLVRKFSKRCSKVASKPELTSIPKRLMLASNVDLWVLSMAGVLHYSTKLTRSDMACFIPCLWPCSAPAHRKFCPLVGATLVSCPFGGLAPSHQITTTTIAMS